MSKTNYINGSYLTPEALDSYIGTSAGTGHLHTNLDSSSSAPYIDLTAHVTGILPPANMSTIDLSNGMVTGILPMSHVATVHLDSTQVTGNLPIANISGTSMATCTMSLRGADFQGGVDIPLTVGYAIWNGACSLYFPSNNLNLSASNTLIIKAGTLPAGCRPITTQFCPLTFWGGGSWATPGIIQISPTGDFTCGVMVALHQYTGDPGDPLVMTLDTGLFDGISTDRKGLVAGSVYYSLS